jgi:hypothetical protein
VPLSLRESANFRIKGRERSRLSSVPIKLPAKAACTKEIRRYQRDFAWQSGFYDRVIRSDRELDNIRQYIHYNPANWAKDEDFGL